MFVHLAKHVESVPQNLVALELGLGPVWREFFNLKRVSISQVFAKSIDGLAEYALSLSLLHLEGTNLVDQVIEHVTQMHGVQHAESEIDREFQPRLARRSL